MFTKCIIQQENVFDELSKSTKFDDVVNGRKGAILVDINNEDKLVPIVRTTTMYDKPAQHFLSIHYDLIENIKRTSNNPDLKFNNAMIEMYDSSYRTMKAHSDQALDLDPLSHICIFSCYNDPFIPKSYMRKLKIQRKNSDDQFDIILEHNSFLLFSLDTNQRHLHKIVLEDSASNNYKWLGVTFRMSKTYIKFINEIPYFHSTNKVLRIASTDEKKGFYICRSKENQSVEYVYPEIDYTISVSDTLYPI